MCGDGVHVSIRSDEHGPDVTVITSSPCDGVLREHTADLAMRLYREAREWEDERHRAAWQRATEQSE